MAERDIVIIGIGHSIIAQNAQSQIITSPSLYNLAKDFGYNSKLNCVTEYLYCAALAELIVKELDKLNITGLTSNRYNGAIINGGSKVATAMGAEVRAINQVLPTYGNKVKAAINLHLNASKGQGHGYESFSPNTDIGKKLGQIFDINIPISIDVTYRKSLFATVENKGTNGMIFPLSTRVPACLLELFFIDNNEDLRKGLEGKDKLAKAIAQSFKQFCDKDYPTYNPVKAIEESHIKSSALITDKIKSTFDDEQIKTVALQSQAKLLPIEREFGEGGDKFSLFNKNHIEIVGTKPIPFDPTLIDPNGNVSNKLILREGGVVNKQKTYPLFQNIDYTSDIPSGKKTVFVHSLYELKAYESNFDSSGHTRINAGGNLKVTSSQQLDLAAAYNLTISANANIDISCPELGINGNTTITGSLGVNGGALISGSLYAEGGLSAPSFNGPAVIDKTNSQELYGYLSSDNLKIIIGESTLFLSKPIVPGDTTLSISGGELKVSSIDSGLGSGRGGGALVTIPGHLHYFKRLNGSLSDSIINIQTTIAPQINN